MLYVDFRDKSQKYVVTIPHNSNPKEIIPKEKKLSKRSRTPFLSIEKKKEDEQSELENIY